MTESAITQKSFSYSKGNYGRPLLYSYTAGLVLEYFIRKDNKNCLYKRYLVPGIFIKFEVFAKSGQRIVSQHYNTQVSIVAQEFTPDSLKVKIKSKIFLTKEFNLKKIRNRIKKAIDYTVYTNLNAIETLLK